MTKHNKNIHDMNYTLDVEAKNILYWEKYQKKRESSIRNSYRMEAKKYLPKNSWKQFEVLFYKRMNRE